MVLLSLAPLEEAAVRLVKPHPPRADGSTDAALEALIKEARRRAHRRRLLYGAIGLVVASAALLGYFGFDRGGGLTPTANEPTPPPPRPRGIFADVAGWIVFSNDRVNQGAVGIWAVDPTRPNDLEARIQLSDRPGEPLAWSSDGSKLLIERHREGPRAAPGWTGLFVLNADGTETRVVTNNPKLGDGVLGWIGGGSFSPDGSQVVFTAGGRDFSQSSAESVGGIYTVDADGGIPRLVLAARSPSSVSNPAFSPDGTQIAYLEALGETSVSLRVVNADGTGVRVLHDVCGPFFASSGPAWSPDGTHIAYGCQGSLWVVNADGSGVTKMPFRGHSPYWSPDGSRIALVTSGVLAIADADGTNIQLFGAARAGPWNPLPLVMPGESVEGQAHEPTPPPLMPRGIFADVAGWIVFSNDRVNQGPLGIWAIDPMRPNDLEARIQLSDRPEEALAWSSDGSRLLVGRGRGQQGPAPSWKRLLLLRPDATETEVARCTIVGSKPLGCISGGSFSPDGSQVVFAAYDGIYTVDADPGDPTPRLVLAARSRTDVFNPAFSPDGTQIAYADLPHADFPGDKELSIRVVNADGSGVRVFVDNVCGVYPRVGGPAWSPDATHIAFSCGVEPGVWVIGADGSGVTQVIPNATNPHWSPDGSRIAFRAASGVLGIADADGTNVQKFGAARAGPWNPLP
jgi:Tol biopolymer transport system component